MTTIDDDEPPPHVKRILEQQAESDAKPEYKVGYKKPPIGTRFQKGGPSPNPKGRPPKDASFQQVVEDELNRKIAINENGRRRKVPVTKVALRQLGNKAAAGDLRAIKELTKLYQQVSPLKAKPEMSEEERRFREESAKKLVGVLRLGLDAMAEKKEWRPRPGSTDDTDDGAPVAA